MTIARFFAKGMLMNVLAAMEYSIADEAKSRGSSAWPRAAGRRTHATPLFFLQQLSNQSLDRDQTKPEVT